MNTNLREQNESRLVLIADKRGNPVGQIDNIMTHYSSTDLSHPIGYLTQVKDMTSEAIKRNLQPIVISSRYGNEISRIRVLSVKTRGSNVSFMIAR